MPFLYLLGVLALGAYALQVVLGLRQLKHFNLTYQEMRRKGRVVIGRRSGKFRAGTIVIFAVDQAGKVLDARKMQGVSVMAKFKAMPSYLGQDIHYLDTYNPLVRQENKLLQVAIEDARELFVRIEAGNYKDVPKVAPLLNMTDQFKLLGLRLKLQFKK